MLVTVQFSRSLLSDTLQPHGLQPPSLSFTNFWSLLKLVSIELLMPSNYLILCLPLLLPPSIFLSIRVFSNESVLIRWPKFWSFSFSISPSNEYSGLMSFRIDRFDLHTIQGDYLHYQPFNSKCIFAVVSHTQDTTHKFMGNSGAEEDNRNRGQSAVLTWQTSGVDGMRFEHKV